MTEEETWFDGFATALLFAQAHADKEGGHQVLQTHLPDERWDGVAWQKIEDFEQKFTKAIQTLDDEGGITCHRFLTVEEPHHYNTWDVEKKKPKPVTEMLKVRVLQLGGSEGYHGVPDWADD